MADRHTESAKEDRGGSGGSRVEEPGSVIAGGVSSGGGGRERLVSRGCQLGRGAVKWWVN